MNTFATIAAASLITSGAAFGFGGAPEVIIIDDVGDFVGAGDISADGSVVLLADIFGNTWLWNEQDGATYIGGVGLGPLDLSADGKTVVAGQVEDGFLRAAAWTEDTGWQILDGEVDSCDANISSAWGASDTGLVTGMIWESCHTIPVVWDNGVMSMLEAADNDSARPSAIAGNGSIMGGWQQTNMWTPAVWYPDGSQVLLDPGSAGQIEAFNYDGTYAVGIRNGEAFRWSEKGGFEMLGVVGGGLADSSAWGLSDDGDVIVGRTGEFFDYDAFIWTPDLEMVLLQDHLESLGATGLDDIRMDAAWGVSADGRTIVGTTTDDFFNITAYVVHMPGPACPADLNGDTIVNATDLVMLLGAWGTNGAGANLAPPLGVVNANDLIVLLGAWGPCP